MTNHPQLQDLILAAQFALIARQHPAATYDRPRIAELMLEAALSGNSSEVQRLLADDTRKMTAEIQARDTALQDPTRTLRLHHLVDETAPPLTQQQLDAAAEQCNQDTELQERVDTVRLRTWAEPPTPPQP